MTEKVNRVLVLTGAVYKDAFLTKSLLPRKMDQLSPLKREEIQAFEIC